MRGRWPLLRSAWTGVHRGCALPTRTPVQRRSVRLLRLRFDDERWMRHPRRLSVRRRRGLRSGPALRVRGLHVRREVMLQRLLQRRCLRSRHLGERVRQRRSSLCGVPAGRHLCGRGMQQLRVPQRLLQRDDVQHAVRFNVRCRRPGVHGMRHELRRRLLRQGGVHLRRAERMRRGTEVRRRPLRLRCDVVSRVLRRDDVQSELGHHVRSRWRHVRRLRRGLDGQLLGEWRLSMRGERPLQPRPALLSGLLRMRRDVLSRWLLQRNRVHTAVAAHLCCARRDMRRV